eukprot:5365656-Pleurochrysis_carterae.AAC.2
MQAQESKRRSLPLKPLQAQTPLLEVEAPYESAPARTCLPSLSSGAFPTHARCTVAAAAFKPSGSAGREREWAGGARPLSRLSRRSTPTQIARPLPSPRTVRAPSSAWIMVLR